MTQKTKEKDPALNNQTDDKVTIMLSKRDVSAFAICINAGVLGVQQTQNTMKLAVTLPPDIDKYFEDTTHDAGVLFERVMKLARARWPEGLRFNDKPAAAPATPEVVSPSSEVKVTPEDTPKEEPVENKKQSPVDPLEEFDKEK